MQADYRQDGKEELIVCSVDGEVRGYLPAGIDQVSEHQSLGLGLESKELQELTQKRQVWPCAVLVCDSVRVCQ